ncbi:hypothetical protein [Micromonospora purpureochromogenes]|uniref:DUF3592 domain-containing protein n=1 Tax=Micromonospora purpureochromogenes TaxID=47872 RepID=A0ABX2RFT6_9ACTN|nr:hypothetical protein [Micromonospora purpureochromogenes]NYF55350.1 hypothetical protein [Micromonospora purpureochromogenes]
MPLWSPNEPIMPKPTSRLAALVPGLVIGAAVLLFGLVSYGRAICLEVYGTPSGAEVVAERHIRPSSVTVRLADTGREVKLRAWRGSPQVGDTLTVTRWGGLVKDTRAFAPGHTPVITGTGVLMTGVQLIAVHRIRRRARDRELYG